MLMVRINNLLLKYNKHFSFLLVDYSKNTQYPTPIYECFEVYKNISKLLKDKHFILAGDSAGGNITINVINKIIETNIKIPTAQICMSPWVMADKKSPSYYSNQKYDYLNDTVIRMAQDMYHPNSINIDERSLLNLSYEGFPPTLIRAGMNEMLIDEIVELSLLMKKSNVYVKLDIRENMPHDFDFFHGLIESFDVGFYDLVNFIIEYSI
jgi:acetyl esterase/lipase